MHCWRLNAKATIVSTYSHARESGENANSNDLYPILDIIWEKGEGEECDEIRNPVRNVLQFQWNVFCTISKGHQVRRVRPQSSFSSNSYSNRIEALDETQSERIQSTKQTADIEQTSRRQYYLLLMLLYYCSYEHLLSIFQFLLCAFTSVVCVPYVSYGKYGED